MFLRLRHISPKFAIVKRLFLERKIQLMFRAIFRHVCHVVGLHQLLRYLSRPVTLSLIEKAVRAFA